jgi:hypothetical protein
MLLQNLASAILLLAFLVFASAATWVVPGIIAAITSALATAQTIPSLTRRDTFVIARHWFIGLAAGTFAGFVVYVLLGLGTFALTVLAIDIPYATRLYLDVLFRGVSIAAGGAVAGWASARLLIPQFVATQNPKPDAA